MARLVESEKRFLLTYLVFSFSEWSKAFVYSRERQFFMQNWSEASLVFSWHAEQRIRQRGFIPSEVAEVVWDAGVRHPGDARLGRNRVVHRVGDVAVVTSQQRSDGSADVITVMRRPADARAA